MTDEWDTKQAEATGNCENSTAEVTDGDGWFNSAADAEYTWDLPEEEVTTDKNSTTATESDGFQLQGKRLRRKDVRQHKASKRSTREHGAIEVSRDVPEEHHFKEKFAQRGDKRKSRKAEWKSELDQMAELRQRLQKLGGRNGFGSDTSKQLIVPSNPLVAKYEQETTDHYGEEWRRIPLVPSSEELERGDVEVPVNTIDGPWESVEEYLSTHYELIREDVTAGLRDAVMNIRQNPLLDDNHSMAIYENVIVKGLTFNLVMGVAVKVSFSLNRAGKKVKWKGSKRLVAGTLVCISQDNFQTFKVATVAARPMSGLELDPPEVDLLFNVDELEIDVNKPFLMVESRSGYFEAFKWVLRAMQRMSEKTMALHNHIVGLDREVGHPQYVVDNPTYNLESVFPDPSNQDLVKEMNILEEWPPELKNTMDESQTEALRTILTKRVAIIQGPPGTGKTYTSVMALHALLQNMSEDDPPIIVACQTNHALDQLLKHVYEFEQDIIRLGGRTKETGPIKERTMFNVRKLASNVIIQGGGNPGHYSRQMDNVRQKMVELLQPLLPDFFSPETLFEYGQINAKQQTSLVDGVNDWVTACDDNKPSSIMALWLRDSIMPVQRAENIYSNMEEAEANYEALLDQEAEFQSGPGNVDDFKEELQGFWQSIIHKYTVRPEEGDNASIDKAMNTTNMWKIPAGLRAAVYERWAGEVTRQIREKIIVLNKEFSKLSQQLKIARMQKDAFLISQSKLVGMTTTGLSKYRSLIAACKPKVILIEEAAEVLEAPVLVGCLPDIQQMILVGDHQQLKGKCNVKDLEGEPYFLDTSLFERLVQNDMPYVTLRTQRRMRPEIREVLHPIYDDLLIDHDSVLGREDIQGMGGVNVYWHCHNQYESSTADSPSKRNVFEAGMIAGFVNYLIHNGTAPEKITILTFYTGQQAEIFIGLRRYEPLKRHLRTIKIVTVDSYQGEENDIVILSLVRSNSEQKIGFLENENRVCVALSRAQRGFYVFGDIALLSGQSVIWWEIGKIFNKSPSRVGYKLPITCQRHNTRTMIEDHFEWIDIDGGCRLPCGETREDCGHKCFLKCHPLSHDKYPCAEPCLKKIPICGHTCSGGCGQACRCERCGHWADPPEEEDEEDEKEEQTKAKEVENKNLGFGGISKPVEKVRRKKTGKYANAVRG